MPIFDWAFGDIVAHGPPDGGKGTRKLRAMNDTAGFYSRETLPSVPKRDSERRDVHHGQRFIRLLSLISIDKKGACRSHSNPRIRRAPFVERPGKRVGSPRSRRPVVSEIADAPIIFSGSWSKELKLPLEVPSHRTHYCLTPGRIKAPRTFGRLRHEHTLFYFAAAFCAAHLLLAASEIRLRADGLRVRFPALTCFAGAGCPGPCFAAAGFLPRLFGWLAVWGALGVKASNAAIA